MCNGSVELKEISENWLTLYCPNCDREFERAATKDIDTDSVSVEDLKHLANF